MKRYLALPIVAVAIALPGCMQQASAAPCDHHTTDRAQCREHYARTHSRFPTAPVTWREVANRVPDYQGFLRIGRCEQPGAGYAGINWRVSGPTYEGGLGFAASTWDGWRPRYYPDNAGDASPQQQVLVADAVRDSVGVTAWGCSGAF